MLVEDRSAAVRQLQPLCFVIEETQRLATADEPSPPLILWAEGWG